MGNLLRTIFSALRQWDETELRARERGRRTAAPARIPDALPRHRVSLTATASFGFAGIPEEIQIRNINEKGLYFYTGRDMPVGSTFDIVAVLPPEINGNHEGRRVHYEAKVIRVERDRGKEHYGVGASIRRCETFALPTVDRKAALQEVPLPKVAQPTEVVRETIQPVRKIAASVHLEGTIRPAAPVEELIAPIEETIAHTEETVPPAPLAVADDSASADHNRLAAKARNQAIVERLATAALRAGISIEELIRLVDSGLTPAELVDVIEVRLIARVQ